jgi:hypothetical protein
LLSPFATEKTLVFLLKKIEVANVPARRAARRTVTKIAGEKVAKEGKRHKAL